MRYLKKFDNLNFTDEDLANLLKPKPEPSDAKKQIISQLNETIDDAFLSILDFGFKLGKGHESQRHWDIVRVYTRYNPERIFGPSPVGLEINGKIDNGEIKYDSKIFPDYKKDIEEVLIELENSLHIINGINGIDLNFSFTNFYGQDKIIISIKI